MKSAEIRKLSATELMNDVVKLREDITELRRRTHMGELQNVRSLRNKRKELARKLTVLSEQLNKETK